MTEELTRLPGVMNAEQAAEWTEWVKTPEGQTALEEHLEVVLRRVHGPEGVKEFFGTENVDGQSKTFDQRISRCYELAVWALVMGTAPKGAKLVHGTIHGPFARRRIGHGWLRLPGGKVWEPITAKVYNEAQWVEYAAAKVERVYPKTQARMQLVLTENFGRWHKSRHP